MPSGAFASDTHVDLELADGVQEARVVPIAVSRASLPPARRYVDVDAEQSITQPLRVVGIAPVMHIRGDVMHVVIERGDASTCLATFDHWHANDRQLFRLTRPARVEPGDRMRVSCVFGTLGRDAPMVIGDGIDDEECVAYLFVTGA